MMALTPRQLSALPEFQATRIERLPNGDDVLHRVEPRFRAYTIKPDDVLLFHDADGAWFVDYHLEGGPYKRRAML
jgi:hypothetical protein